MPKIYDSIVIGGGPAGMTTALNLLRGGKTVLIIEKENFGGQIASSPRVENIPGTKEISGIDFSNNLFDQISDLGVDFELEDVSSIEKKDNFIVHTNYGDHESKTVVIATGVTHRHLGLPREEELVGHGISYCAVCDGAFYKNEEIALIGDGNTALQYSLLLANYCKKVTVCTLFDKFFGDKILVDRLKNRENIEVKHNLSIQEFIGEPDITALRFIDTTTKKDVLLNVKACFVAIGQIPSNDKFIDLVDLDKGFIVVDNHQETKTKGLFAVGDCTKKEVKQVSTACNDGSIASFYIIRSLN